MGYGESNTCCFQRNKNVVLGTKKGQLAFSERQQQLVNSGNNISFLRIIRKFESSAGVSEQVHSS